jgi:deoxyhypusine monooxygenase
LIHTNIQSNLFRIHNCFLQFVPFLLSERGFHLFRVFLQMTTPSLSELQQTLHAESAPMHERISALFHLRTMATPSAIQVILDAFFSTSDLLLHELAYVLGQIGSPLALPKLTEILTGNGYSSIVRHEAAEAMGAIGDTSVLPILMKYANEEFEKERCVFETCQIAVGLLQEQKDKKHGPTGYELLPCSTDKY